MSDEEMFVDVNDEEDDEHDASIKEELIAFVKANPALYAKNWKEYAGKNFCKDLAWNRIGCSLSKQISGKDAAKMWNNIRQRFGRERRKVVAAQKGKSGQETKPLYVPKWSLYPHCLFLADHIMPRKTASNYTSHKRKTTTVGKTSFSSPMFILPSPSSSSSSPLTPRSTPSPYVSSPQALSPQVLILQAPSSQAPWSQTLSSQALSAQAASPQTPSSQALSLQAASPQTPSSQALSPQAASPQAPWLQALSPQAAPSQTPSPQAAYPQTPSPQAVVFSPSNVWSNDLESTYSDDVEPVSSIEDSKRKEVVIHASTSLPSSLNVKKCSALSPSEKALKAMQKTSIKRTVPEPDQFAKRKKQEDDSFMQEIVKQSTVLTNVATKLEESLVKEESDKCISQPSQANVSTASVLSVNDPILVAIGYALKSVPEEKRLECMCEVLNVIKSKSLQR